MSFVGILMVVCFMLGVSVSSAEEMYVVDNAKLFSAAELQTLQEKASNLEEMTDAKIMIFVDKTFHGKNAEEVAQKKYEEYHLPDKGVMIVLATEEGQIAVHTEMMDAALDSVMPLLQAKKISEGLISLQDKFIKYFDSGNMIEVSHNEVTQDNLVVVPVETKFVEPTNTVVEKVVYKENHTSMALYGCCFILFIGIVLLIVVNSCRVKKIKNELEIQKEQVLTWQAKMKEKEAYYKEEIDEWCASAEARTSEIQHLNQRLSESKKRIQEYEDEFEIISLLHPNLATEMEEYYRKKQEEADQQSARNFDASYLNAMDGPVKREKLNQYQTVMQHYNHLTEGEKRWISVDIESLQKNLSAAEELQKEYEKEQETLRCQELARKFEYDIGIFNQSMASQTLEKRYQKVNSLMNDYNVLPKQAKSILKGSSVQIFEQLYQKILGEWKEEERRKREEQERREREEKERREREARERRAREERRRRMNSSYSYGSSSSSSSSRSFKSSSSGSSSSRSFGGGSFGGGKSRGGGSGRSF